MSRANSRSDRMCIGWAATSFCLLFTAGLAGAESISFQSPTEELITPRRAAAVAKVFEEQDYVLARTVDSGHAPRIYLHSMPLDMAKLRPVQEKKDLFIRILLPLVLKANAEVESQRDRLLKLRNQPHRTADDEKWVAALAETYSGSTDDLDGLLERVDTVPVALVLAQGIDESGWGTSRFARVGDSLFGQHGSAKGPQIGAAHADGVGVAAFDSMLASVQGYLRNLNSSHAYRALRKHRATLRAKGNDVRGADLVTALEHYSERGNAYVRELQSIMRVNGLEALDATRLSPSGGSLLILPK